MVSVDQVRDSVAAHGERYLKRIYTPREIWDSSTQAIVDPARLAARFAAKEATFKVLRVGDEPVSWRDVEVRARPLGLGRATAHGPRARRWPTTPASPSWP